MTARFVEVPVCLIEHIDQGQTQIIACNTTADHHYPKGNKQELLADNYCGTVLKNRAPLQICNALNDSNWQNSSNAQRGIVAYLGVPLLWPDGNVFGTLSALDNKEHHFLPEHHDLLSEFKAAIERDLEILASSQDSSIEKEKMWHAIQSAAMESILVLDPAGNFLDANEIAANRFGMTSSELIGKNLYSIVPPDIATSRKEKIEEVINARTTLRFEDMRDGRYFDFTIYPILDQQNKVEKMVVFAVDITERKTTRQALEKSERKYRELVEEASTIILRWDIEGNVTFFNEYAQKFFGFSEAEILGRNVVGTIVPETEFTGRDLALLMKEIQRDPAKFKDNENENIKRNGERVWIAWKNRPIFNKRGELIEIHSVGIDITARKRAEDALRESEALFRSLTESSSDHVLTLDENLNIQFVNFASPGLSREQLIGTPLYNYVAKERQQEIKNILEHALKTGERCSYETEYASPDGTTIHYESVVAPKIVADRIVGLTLNARDVTERKRVQEALQESEERLKQAQEVGHVGTWDWRPQTGELVWSDEVYRILGFSPREFMPSYKLFLERVHPDDRSYLHTTVEQSLNARQPYNIDCRIITKHGVERITNAQGTVRHDENGVPVQMLGTFQDITDRKQIEKELMQYRNHLEELVAIRTVELEISNRELESYSYSIAHDLRAPLRAITGFSQILQEDARDKLGRGDLEILDRIIAAGKNMSELIDDILELSRITRSELYFDNVDLSRLGNEIVSRLRQSQPDKDIDWKVQNDLIVRGDSRLLEVALQNLIENAWKYTRDKKPAQIQLASRQEKGEVIYFIKDNGVGFDMKYGNQLFKPFHRLHSPKDFEGTGIGLATVQRIIQRHGGRIWANTREGAGATFYFTLRNYKAI